MTIINITKCLSSYPVRHIKKNTLHYSCVIALNEVKEYFHLKDYDTKIWHILVENQHLSKISLWICHKSLR